MAKNFNQLDLNLLRSFLVLYQTQNTTKAAEILNLSQSAVSKILQRLREHFADELFLRTSKGLIATPKADEIGQQLPQVFKSLMDVCESNNSFDPKQLTGVVKIAGIASILEVCGVELFKTIRQLAPNLEVHLYNWSNETRQNLLSGEIDFGLNYAPLDMPKIISCRPIAIDDYIILTRHGHPLQRLEFSLDEFVKYPFATNIIPEFNSYHTHVERICAKEGYKLNMCLRSAQLSNLANIIEQTDTIMAATEICSYAYPQKWKAIKSEKFNQYDINPLSLALYFHARNRGNPKHIWLEGLIKDLILNIKSR